MAANAYPMYEVVEYEPGVPAYSYGFLLLDTGFSAQCCQWHSEEGRDKFVEMVWDKISPPLASDDDPFLAAACVALMEFGNDSDFEIGASVLENRFGLTGMEDVFDDIQSSLCGEPA